MKNSAIHLSTATVVGLLLSYVMVIRCHQKINVYEQKLDATEKKYYQNIKKNRIYYYSSGLILSIVLVAIYLYRYKLSYSSVIYSLLIILLVPMVVYLILPKPDYMLLHSNKNAQEWFKVYLCMKNSMIYGFLIGFIGSLICSFIYSQIK